MALVVPSLQLSRGETDSGPIFSLTSPVKGKEVDPCGRERVRGRLVALVVPGSFTVWAGASRVAVPFF